MQLFHIAFLIIAAFAADQLQDCSECGLRPDEMVLRWGYPVESHSISTQDGFKLRMIRIPYGIKNDSSVGHRPPVLLQHGLLDSASTWVSNLPAQSLPFILADAGYDVWLGNNRGNKWSLPSCDSQVCWDFSFDEFIQYDFPAFINFILSKSHFETVTYIGHSQGTLQAFGGLSISEEIQKKVNLFVALAPVAYVGHLESLLMVAAAKLNLEQLVEKFGFKEFLPSSKITQQLAIACDYKILNSLCEEALFLVMGKNPTNGHNLNSSRLAVLQYNFPAGTSVKNIAHWAQIVRDDTFRMFDYGKAGNLQKYSQEIPPDYDLSKIKVPVATFTGGYDKLADPDDAERIESILSDSGALVLAHKEEEYDHADFIIGMDAHERIYPLVIDLLSRYSGNPSRAEII